MLLQTEQAAPRVSAEDAAFYVWGRVRRPPRTLLQTLPRAEQDAFRCLNADAASISLIKGLLQICQGYFRPSKKTAVAPLQTLLLVASAWNFSGSTNAAQGRARHPSWSHCRRCVF